MNTHAEAAVSEVSLPIALKLDQATTGQYLVSVTIRQALNEAD